MNPQVDPRSEGGEVPKADSPALDATSRQHLLQRFTICVALAAMLLAVVVVIAFLGEFPGYVLLAATVAALLGPMGWFVTVCREDIYKLGASKGAVRKTVVVATVFCLVAAGVIVIGYWTRKELIRAPTALPPTTSAGPTSTTSPSVSTTTTPSAPSAGTSTLDGHCNPANPSDWKIPDYELCVIAWCEGIVVFPNGSVDESRFQVKVRPRISNNTGAPLDVTIWKTSALRLLVRSSDLPDSWQPPKKTAEFGDKPYLVDANDGQRYWAVAPNIPKDVDLPDDMTKPTDIGFATFWGASSIPHDSAYPPLTQGYDANGRLDQDGDLVFQLPATTASNSLEFVAVVLVDRADPAGILATAWLKDWGPKRDPKSF